MITVRKANDRGRTRLDWLDSAHTFSFGGYRDPEHTGFHSLRVINDDVVAPGGGFGAHPHRDMEILTWVVDGALEHRDSEGGGGVIRPGDVQRMRAGRGIVHSEMNASADAPVRLLQIWIEPDRLGLAPGYASVHFDEEALSGQLRRVAGADPGDGRVAIAQDAAVYAGRLAAGDEVALPLRPDRHGWLQVVDGDLSLEEAVLSRGDGAAIEGVDAPMLRAVTPSEVLFFDLA